MQTLDVHEAAQLLHLNVKRVQGMARTGQLPAARVGRKWLFQREQLERMLGGAAAPTAPAPTSPGLEISARNHLRGTVTSLQFDGLMAEVRLAIGDQVLVSMITRSSAERLGLEVGREAIAIIKSTEVMIGREGGAR
jgi:molybdopterin-binding protein